MVPPLSLVILKPRTALNLFSHKHEVKHYQHFRENHIWAFGHLKSIPLNESVSVCSNTGKTVGRVANTPHLDQSLTVSSIQQRERHELTPEEAKEGFIMAVTKHMALNFPSRPPDGLTERLYSYEPGHSHYVTTGLLLPWGGCEWPHPNTGTGLHLSTQQTLHLSS